MTPFEDLGDDADNSEEGGSGLDDLDAALDPDAQQPEEREVQSDTDDEVDSRSDPKTTPAFEYDDTKNAAQYVRPETAKQVDDAWEFDVKPYLGREIGLENVAKREWQDAILRYAAQNPEQVAELVIQARENSHGSIEE